MHLKRLVTGVLQARSAECKVCLHKASVNVAEGVAEEEVDDARMSEKVAVDKLDLGEEGCAHRPLEEAEEQMDEPVVVVVVVVVVVDGYMHWGTSGSVRRSVWGRMEDAVEVSKLVLCGR